PLQSKFATATAEVIDELRLRRVQRHRVRIDGAEPIAGVSTIHQDQADTLDALKISKPNLNAQMSLL
ncbi:MAG: IS1634 family transposase, partial [Rhizobacter sp.]